MTDLERFAAHCRDMATAEHTPECCRCGTSYCCGCPDHPGAHPGWGETYPDMAETWRKHAEKCPGNPSAPACPGCVTDADRALWERLADEAEAWLSTEPEAKLL